MLGKVLLRALVVGGGGLGLALAATLAAGGRPFAPGGPAALALFALLITGYSLFWFALAVAVNAWGHSSSANALGLVAAWLALVVVVPGLGSVAVDALVPSPSRVELVNLTRDAARDASARATAIEGDHGKEASADKSVQAALRQADLEQRVRPVLREFEERRAAQQRWVDRLRFMSPALLMSEGVTEVAGSGVVRHQHFTAQVDAFHQEHARFFRERIEARATIGATDYPTMPVFRFEELPASVLITRVGASVVALFALAALLTALAAVGLRKNLSRGLR
ncbi:MAG: DUF3526 domain-containing protein [Polyangiaceae bacterium]|nr:DUF3526 domain-containing protein [Polyangiaceae bacterium]